MRSRRYHKRISELAKKANKRRWDKDRARREAEMPARIAQMALEKAIGEGALQPGDYLGTLQWRQCDGSVRKWIVRQGSRSNQIRVDGVTKEHGWTWLLDRLRRHLACLTYRQAERFE
jgi:hypothetical protein